MLKIEYCSNKGWGIDPSGDLGKDSSYRTWCSRAIVRLKGPSYVRKHEMCASKRRKSSSMVATLTAIGCL